MQKWLWYVYVIFHLFIILLSALLSRETLSSVIKNIKNMKFHKPNVFQFISFVLIDMQVWTPLLFHSKNPIASRPYWFLFLYQEQTINIQIT